MMRSTQRAGRTLLGAALAALLAGGCDAARDGLPREPISGTVTFDGKPLDRGTIQFQPSSQAEGMAAGGMIADGKFSVPREEGPVPGKYKVQIDSMEGTVTEDVPQPVPTEVPGEAAMPGELKIPLPKKRKRRLIPTKYNSQTELTAEVKADGPNTYEFNLTK